MSADLQERMQAAVDEGRCAPLEPALADWALRHGGSAPVAVALASCARAVAEGHSCLSLDHELPAIAGEKPFCNRETLDEALRSSALVGEPGQGRPLILDHDRLYLHRYWHYENTLAERLSTLLAGEPATVDVSRLAPAGGTFDYDWVDEGETHWQAVAAFVALRHRFAVISGGPGTGKTYTVLRLIRLLIESARANGDAIPIIRLAAPTGKAAARMVESTRLGLEDMAMSKEVADLIPLEARTLHRLVGIGFGTTRPRYNRENPLPADVVIVDEASMIDLPMMAKLLDALPDHARLILLGDRYQLASVESGSVLADLCTAAGPINAFTPEQQEAAGPLLATTVSRGNAPLADHVVTLQTSHRFSADSPIGRLATAVNAGDADRMLEIAASNAPAITLTTEVDEGRIADLVDEVAQRNQALISATEPEAALAALQQHCLLCAVRRGRTGSETLNRRITQRLAELHGFDPLRSWYHGRPVIVTRNDPRAGLYNGDIGVCLSDENQRFRVYFYVDGAIRAFLPTALPEHETVYAMTVHKSQGSEFDHVTLVLPTEDSQILSRELLYTGITRARESVMLVGADVLFRAAVSRQLERHSGLGGRVTEP